MSSNLEIEKRCMHCGKKFIAKTTVTKYCGDVCAKKAYKARKRNEKIEKSNMEAVRPIEGKAAALPVGDYLTVKDAAALLGCSTRTIQRMVKNNQIPHAKLGERLTRIRRADLDALFPRPDPDPEINLNELYNMSEIIAKYGISEKALYEIVKRNKIPKVAYGRFVYVPRVIIDKLLT